MATRKEIVADIRQQYGNLLTTAEVGRYLGLCPKTTREYMQGVPCYDMGRKRCYLAIDVASRIAAGQL